MYNKQYTYCKQYFKIHLTLSLRRHLNNAQSCYTEHHNMTSFLAGIILLPR